ncbi:Uncharacterized protein OBRU01_11549, partial [Operophtera brumata]
MAAELKNLESYAIIGFDGSAIRGLKVHPGCAHIVYPMGNKVCIQEWKSKKMYFLSGHTNSVSTVAVSPKGKYVGSGQINHIGFKASAKLWDFEKKSLIGTHELHKVRVEALAFSSDERYMISLGGRDDGCVVLWDCLAGAATGTAAAAKLTTGDAITLTALNRRTNAFVTGGDTNLRVWNVRAESKNLDVVDVSLGKLRRCVRCIAVSADDTYGYAGTTTGDMIKFSIGYPPDPMESVAQLKPTLLGCLAKCGPLRKGQRPETICYSLVRGMTNVEISWCCTCLRSTGIEAILIMEDACLVVGGGDGTIDVLDEINWAGNFPKGNTQVDGCITSLELMESAALRGDRRLLLAGTRGSEIYAINIGTFAPMLVITCHRCAINDVAFPRGMSGVFATGGAGSVRVWCLASCQELLRVSVPNFTCSAVLFSGDGKSIISAWSDGNVRAFTPLTGRLIYCIYNTHNKGTSALDCTSDGRTLISGGCEGQVRLWDIRPESQTLKKVLKEHKSPVSAIQVSPNDTEAVSAGTDGSCIIWDLVSLSRRQVMYANTLFMCVCFEPLGCQLLTGGTDRCVSYWETGSGNLAREVSAHRAARLSAADGRHGPVRVVLGDRQTLAREVSAHKAARLSAADGRHGPLEASKQGAINGIHVSRNGELFVTGGNDQIIKLWKYQEGIYTHMGVGHAGAVTCCRFSPDSRYIVSCCAAGTVIVWKVPEVCHCTVTWVGRRDVLPLQPRLALHRQLLCRRDRHRVEGARGMSLYCHMGVGHAGAVTCCRFSPDSRYIVSCCAAGTVIVWKVPELRLPLGAAAQRAAGDRAHRLSAKPSKEEKISAMDTSRGSVHACCPCDTARTDPSNTTPKSTASKTCCRPP